MITRSCTVASGALVAIITLAVRSAPIQAGETHTVIVRNFEFDPAQIEVKPGDTIEWVWESGLHTVTSGIGCSADGELFDAFVFIGNPLVVWDETLS